MEFTAQQVCDDILALLERMKFEWAKTADMLGLTRVQMVALILLHRHGKLAMGEAANVLHCDASNVTGIVDRLVAQHLVVRKESAHDRRTKTMELTEKGSKLVADILADLPDKLGCSKLSGQERNTLHAIVGKLCA
jgi:DNA-binding MarR family transcriptional regulator